jgi:very-short-patch-repair endonuclease
MATSHPTPSTAHQVLHGIAGELDAHVAIRALAERQHGVVARRQLLELGCGRGLVQGRIDNGVLIPIHRGVFAVGHARIGKRGQWIAAVLASGPGAVLSHGSAIELWGLRESFGPPEVTRRSGGSPRAGIRLHQTRVLEDAEKAEKAGIPVTSIERALLDIAPRLDNRQLERTLVAADQGGQLRWPELLRLAERTPMRPGAGRLRRVARAVDPRASDARSPLEVDFLGLCRIHELPLPQVNVWVEGFLVDFVWPAQRVVVETDGYAYHRDRPAFERDHQRTIALTAAGYAVHRATYRMLIQDPTPFLAVVRRSLG